MNVEAAKRKRASSRPSHIRSNPLAGYAQPFGVTATKVVEGLNQGLSLGEAARRAGSRKSTARVIRLRAARRGMLNDVALARLSGEFVTAPQRPAVHIADPSPPKRPVGLCAFCTNSGPGQVMPVDGRRVFVCDRCEGVAS